MDLKKLVDEARDMLAKPHKSEETSLVDAYWIMVELTGLSRTEVELGADVDLDEARVEKFREFFVRKLDGEPLQYILGYECFMGLDFYVNEDVLIPRPETEYLVEYVLKNIAKDGDKFIDMCTGSGCIGISLVKLFKEEYGSDFKKASLVDISEKALEVAKKNAALNDVLDEIDFVESDLFEKISLGDAQGSKLDFIVSNPPYINKKDMEELSLEVKNEPTLALYGGETGLDFYDRIVPESAKRLKDGGSLIVEIGYDEGENVETLFKENGFKEVDIIKDLNGLDRIVKGIYYV